MIIPPYIFLVRHGESEGNVDKSVYKETPDWKVNLTSKGCDQAQKAGERIKEMVGTFPVTIYTSPWYRARQTAQIIRDVLPDVERYYEDPRLREQEWGNFLEDQLHRKILLERIRFGTFFYRMPHGESGADVYDRVSTFLETLHRDFRKNDFQHIPVIVSHGLTIRLFLMRWFHWSVEKFESLRNPANAQVIVMERNRKNDIAPFRFELQKEYARDPN